jgi:hypothetical protein
MIRALTTVLMWTITTVLLAVAIPAMWVQQHLVDRAGYAALAQRAAADPSLQSAMAAELTDQMGRLGSNADPTLVSGIARLYTASSQFPGQFAQANSFAHRWLFTDTVSSDIDAQGRWVIDLAPMLSDNAFAQTLRDYNISVPSAVPIPLTGNAPALLRPGALSGYGRWAPWMSWALVALAAAAAALTLLAARRRGRALTALGVSGLLVGASGWAAIEYVQRYLRHGLDGMSGNLRTVAAAMVATAQESMHQWLNVTLVAGGGLVIVGVIVSLLAGLAAASGAGRRTPART